MQVRLAAGQRLALLLDTESRLSGHEGSTRLAVVRASEEGASLVESGAPPPSGAAGGSVASPQTACSLFGHEPIERRLAWDTCSHAVLPWHPPQPGATAAVLRDAEASYAALEELCALWTLVPTADSPPSPSLLKHKSAVAANQHMVLRAEQRSESVQYRIKAALRANGAKLQSLFTKWSAMSPAPPPAAHCHPTSSHCPPPSLTAIPQRHGAGASAGGRAGPATAPGPWERGHSPAPARSLRRSVTPTHRASHRGAGAQGLRQVQLDTARRVRASALRAADHWHTRRLHVALQRVGRGRCVGAEEL